MADNLTQPRGTWGIDPAILFSKRRDITIVSIDGNTGSGKSTLLNYIEKYYPGSTFQENISEWSITPIDKDGIPQKSLFELYYSDPERYSTLFQINALLTKYMGLMEKIKSCKKGDTIFMERSFIIDKECFAFVCKLNNYMNEVEWRVYNNTFNSLNISGILEPDLMIYLNTSPDTSYNRIVKRHRLEENPLTIVRVNEWNLLHKKCLLGRKILCLNADLDMEENPSLLDSFVDKIMAYIAEKKK